MSSDSEDEYYYNKSSSKRESENSSSRYSSSMPMMNKLRLHDGRRRSPSQRSPGGGYERRYGRRRTPSPKRKHSKHHSQDRYKEGRHGRHFSSSPEDAFAQHRREGFRHERMSTSRVSSPSTSRSSSIGDPNIPERRTIAKPKTEDNVLEQMEHSFTDGPLDSLKHCVHQGIKVMVWVRNQKGIRGICTGYVVAFDKFWNLLMRDVDEAYQKSIKAKCPYLKRVIRSDDIPEAVRYVKPDTAKTSEKKAENGKSALVEKDTEKTDSEAEMKPESSTEAEKPEDPEKTKRRLNRKQRKMMKKKTELCKRNIPRMFVRGDNIVFIRVCN